MKRRIVAWVVAGAVLACLDPFAPPVGTSKLEPPSLYPVLWQSVEDCSGLSGAFSRVRWFVVPESPFPCGELRCAGLWKSKHDVYLGATFVNDSLDRYFTVRHEMLHDLLQGGYHHPPVFERCGLVRVDIGGS